MALTVIIPTKNEQHNLERLLRDLRAQTQQPDAIIVADAKSTDRTRTIAKRYGCAVVPGGHPAKGRNNGAKRAKSDYLLFLDADVRIPDTHFLERSLREMTRRRLDMAIVRNAAGWTGNETRAQRLWLRFMHVVLNNWIRAVSRTPLACGIGTCLFFRAEAFRSIGGFDERVVWGEDTDAVRRVRTEGRFGMLGTRIEASTRRALDQGVVRFYGNVIALDMYCWFRGPIRDWKTYAKVTGRRNHFAFSRKGRLNRTRQTY